MRCVCVFRYGGPDVLSFSEAPCPRCGPDQVLVRVHAAGVNPVDWKVREGLFQSQVAHTFPLILGWDVAGVVTEAGSATTRMRRGDAVFGNLDLRRDGAYAEYVVARESDLAAKPTSLDHVGAAALPLAGLAAWQALVEIAQLRAGQRVLVHAAAGGVGSLAVQLAKAHGAYVIGTAAARNHDFLRDLGADEIVDYEHTRFEDLAPDMDVVLDPMGGETQDRSWGTLRKGGVLVSLAGPVAAVTAAQYGVRGVYLRVMPNALQLAELARLVDAGRLRPIVETVLPLAEAKRAHALSQGGRMRGKIVLQVDAGC